MFYSDSVHVAYRFMWIKSYQNMQQERESGFELMRIVAQVMIVFYHILLFAIYPKAETAFYKALWIPLHIGVPLFVLISGYFGIKPSVKGFIKLAGMVFVLQIAQVIVDRMSGAPSGGLSCFLFISRSPFWFVRTYVYLYLLSPVINKFLKGVGSIERVLLLLVLLFISDYIGNIGDDQSLYEGYNIITFSLFYAVGDTIRRYKCKWENVSRWGWLFLFLGINIVLVSFFSVAGFENRIINTLYVWLFYGYNSPGLLFSSVLLFLFMGSFHFRSIVINRMARASLAIYILHLATFPLFIEPVAEWIYGFNSNVVFVTTATFLLAIVVVFISIIVYWLLTPAWCLIDKLAAYTQQYFDKVMNHLFAEAKRN